MLTLLTWWRSRRKRRNCFHHDRGTGQSWVTDQLINTGAGKMFWCQQCGMTWFA